MIEGLRQPDGGEVSCWANRSGPPRAIQGRIGVQLQTTSLFDMLRARELLSCSPLLRPEGRRRPRRPGARPGQARGQGEDLRRRLSGGQQQRLAIALALVHDPELVFLDEPTTGLDPQARRNLWEVIRAINEEGGKTVVLTTHYLEEAELLCDRVGIMDEARMVALDTPCRPDRLARRRGPHRLHRERRPHAASPRTCSRPCSRCSNRPGGGPQITGLSVRGPTLEDVFFNLTGREFRE